MTLKARNRFVAKKDAEKGELYLYGSIGESWWGGGVTAKAVADAIAQLQKDGAKTLNVYINSPGGSVFEGVAIYNAIKRFDGERIVHVDGLAASIASIIAMAGDRIVMGANAMMMVHNPRALASGEASALRKAADNLDGVRDVMLGTYEKRTGQARADLTSWMDDETWMDAETAKSRGFADEISDESDEDAEEDDVDASVELKVFAEFAKAPEGAKRLLNRVTKRMAPPVTASRPPETGGGPKETKMKLVLAALMLSETATEAEALARVEALKKFQGDVLAAAGKTDPAEALGSLLAHKDAAAKLPDVTARLQQLESAARDAEVNALIEQGKRDGKLTPAQEPWARELGKTSAASLKAYLESAPKIVPVSAPAAELPAATAALSDEDRRVAKAMGIDEKTFAAQKAAALRQ